MICSTKVEQQAIIDTHQMCSVAETWQLAIVIGVRQTTKAIGVGEITVK